MTPLYDRMNRFLIASRDLFNTQFRMEAPYVGKNAASDLRDDCLLVEQALFRVIVGAPSEGEAPGYGETQHWIRVIPSGSPSPPIMLNRELSSGHWDYPLDKIDATDDLRFVRYFDWSDIERRDNRYVMVLVAGSASHPEIVGKLGLIESHQVTYEAIPPEDDPAHPQRFKISFRVTHPAWDAERIFEALRLAPSRAWTVDQPRSTPKDTPLGGLWRNTYCCFPMPVDDGDDLVPWLIERWTPSSLTATSFESSRNLAGPRNSSSACSSRTAAAACCRPKYSGE